MSHLGKHFLRSEKQKEQDQEQEQENQTVKTNKSPFREGPNNFKDVCNSTY